MTQARQIGELRQLDNLESRMADFDRGGRGSSVALRLFSKYLFNEAGCDSTDVNVAIPVIAETLRDRL